MAQVTKGTTYTSNSEVNSTNLNAHVDSATVSNIVNADIDASAAIAYSKLALTSSILNADLAGSIADSKLSQITTASKVSGAAITLLTSLPSAAGLIPIANLISAHQFVTATFDMTQASSTNPTITGAGFTPRGALIIAGIDNLSAMSIGWSDASNHYCIWDQTNGADIANNWGVATTKSIMLGQSGGRQELYFSSFNSDGGVLTNTKVSSPTGTARFMIIFLK